MKHQPSTAQAAVTIEPFGATADGHPVTRWLLRRGSLQAAILTYGGILQQLIVPDRNGSPTDVVLGFDHIEEYETDTRYFGAIVGRCANRIGYGSFRLNGRLYTLPQNGGVHCLHGGPAAFHNHLWGARPLSDGVRLSLKSPDGDQGFPGELNVTVDYRLLSDGLSISYRAVSDRDTLCNLTSHSYFNLNGHGCGDVAAQLLCLESDFFTPLNGDFIPDGQILSVVDTPLDFRRARPIGSRIDSPYAQLRMAGGYDHNFILRAAEASEGGEPALPPAATAKSETTGIVMETLTDMPGLQLYTPNYPEHAVFGKGGASYAGRCAFCLETQYFPNAMAYSHFPQPVLRAGEQYLHETQYRFSVLRR